MVALTIAALDEAGPAPPPRRRRGRLALPRAARARSSVPEERHLPLLECLSRRDLVGLEMRVAALGPGRRASASCSCGCPSCAAGPRCSSAPTGRRGRVEGLRGAARAAGRARRGRPRDLRPRPGARAGLLHRRGVRGLRPGGGVRARRRRALRRPARPLRPRAAGLRRGARRAARAPGPGGRGGARDERRLTIAVPRGALFDGHARPARRARHRHRRGALERPQAAVRRRRHRDDAALATCRPTSSTARPTSASPARTCCSSRRQRNVYELLDLGFGRCRMVVAAREGGDPIGDALRRLGRVRIATKYPRIAAAPLRRHRPPGGDRGGEGLGRAGAAHRPGRRHRGPHRHRPHARRRTACAWSRRSGSARRG